MQCPFWRINLWLGSSGHHVSQWGLDICSVIWRKWSRMPELHQWCRITWIWTESSQKTGGAQSSGLGRGSITPTTIGTTRTTRITMARDAKRSYNCGHNSNCKQSGVFRSRHSAGPYWLLEIFDKCIIKGYELELDSIPRKNSYAGQYFNSTTSNDRLTRDTRSIGYGSDRTVWARSWAVYITSIFGSNPEPSRQPQNTHFLNTFSWPVAMHSTQFKVISG